MQQESSSHDLRTATSQPINEAAAYRKVLKQGMAAILAQNGCELAPAAVHETLTMVMESYLLALSEGTKRAYENANRTRPFYGDVIVALANLGVEEQSVQNFLHCQIQSQLQSRYLVAPTPRIETSSRFPQTLQVGKTRSHPAYVSEGLPPFPDPHTYIKTEITGEPEISYDKVREYAAEVARDSRRLLIDLMLRQFPSICLFNGYYRKILQLAQKTLEEKQAAEENMRQLRRQAAKRAKMEREIKDVKKDFSEELAEDIFQDEPSSQSTLALSASKLEEITEGLKKFDRKETIRNLVHKQLRPYCFVLEPQSEFRPYLSCLVTEDKAEENSDVDKNSSSQKPKEDEINAIVDNAYLRPPRIPSRYESQMEE